MRTLQEMTLQEKLGQRLAAGFQGLEPPKEFLRLIKEYKVGNIILFRRNIQDGPQLKKLCATLRKVVEEETGVTPFITIDQEGGVVTRLPESEVNIPGAMAVAATGNPRNAYDMGLLTAQELRSYGVDFDLAPVMDINCNPDNPVIGVRSYGDTPERVAEYGSQMVRGLLDGGVYCSLKHFPGHGDTAVDSHLGLPCIDRSFDELMQRELKPFIAGIEAGAPAVMTTHILFPQIEPEHIPATMSRRIMTGLLREKLGFGGIIISDCMEMDAIKKFYGTVNGVLAAMKAGVDLVFVSQTPALAAEAMQNARRAAENGELDLAELDVSVQRMLEAKAQCAAMQPKTLGDEAACRARAEEVRAASITAVHLPRGGMPALGDNPLFLGCADYRSTIASNGESSGFTFPEERRRHADKGTALVTDKDPGDAEIAEVVSQAAPHSCIVLGTYNGHILQGQLRLAKALAATGLPMILVALRNPYDLRNMPNHVAALAGWEYTRPLFDALWPVLNGTAPMSCAPTVSMHSSRLCMPQFASVRGTLLMIRRISGHPPASSASHTMRPSRMDTGSGVSTSSARWATPIAASNGTPMPAAVSSTMVSNTGPTFSTNTRSAAGRICPPEYGAEITYRLRYTGLSTTALPASQRPFSTSSTSYTVLPYTPAI